MYIKVSKDKKCQDTFDEEEEGTCQDLQEGPPRKRNYLLGGGLLVIQASPVGECSRNASVSLYQTALL